MSTVGDYLTLSRMPVAITTSVCFVVGGLAAPHPRPLSLVLLGSAGLLLHAFACHLNDLADLEADRRNPARQASPLVRGTVTIARVSFWAVTESLLLACAAMAFGGLWPVRAGFALVIVLTAWVNMFQKTSRLVSPVASDVLFGLAMALPLPLAAWAAGGRPGPATGWLTAAWVCHMVVMNGTVGNLKDLELDRAAGSRTTALVLGVRMEAGRFVFSRRYLRFILGAQVVSLGCIVSACVVSMHSALSDGLGAAAILVASAATAGLARLLRNAGQRPRRPAPRSRIGGLPATWLADVGFVLGNMLAFLLAAAASISPAGAGWLAAVTVAWFAAAAAIRSRGATLRNKTVPVHTG